MGRPPAFLSIPIAVYKATPGGSDKYPFLMSSKTFFAVFQLSELNSGFCESGSTIGPYVRKTFATNGYKMWGGGMICLHRWRSHSDDEFRRLMYVRGGD